MGPILTHAPEQDIFTPISIRYEGNDAAEHQLELSQLGESLQGFARVFAVVAHFIATGRPAYHYDALEVRVLAAEVKDPQCYEVVAFFKGIVVTKEFWSGMAPGLLALVVQYILGRRSKEEMKHLSDALQRAMEGQEATTSGLLQTINKMADALTAPARKALAPIGKSCSSIDLYANGQKIHEMDEETKTAFASARSRVADHSKEFVGVFTNFDITNGAAKVLLEGAAEPTAAKVVDPVFSTPNNPYALALASQAPLGFLAKYEVDGAGNIVKLHIFDTSEM